MAIKVAAGDGGGALALASYAAGAGLRRNQVADDQMQALGRQKAMESQQDFTMQRDQKNFENTMDSEMLRSDMRREDLTYELDATQRAEYNKLSKAYDAAAASGDFTPEELTVMRKEIGQKQMGLQPMPRIKEPPQFGHGMYAGQEYKGADGIPRVIDQNGIPRVPAGWKPPDAGTTGQVDFKQYADELNRVVQSHSEDETLPSMAAMRQEAQDNIKAFQSFVNPTPPPVSGEAIPNVPGPGSLPPGPFDNYMQPGMESIGGSPVQPTLPAPTAEPAKGEPTTTSKRIFDPFKEKMPVQPKANPYSPESVKAYIAKGKFNNKQSSLLSGAAARLDKYQSQIDAADPGSQERVDLVLKRLADYEYLKSQMGAVQ